MRPHQGLVKISISTLDNGGLWAHAGRVMIGTLTAAELLRYSRHLLLPAVGEAGQLRLKHASVLVIGVGALGSPAALYLAAAGVGRLGLVDADVVDASNLQRQILHGDAWVGKPKLESAAASLRELNPLVRVELHRERFNPDNALAIAGGYDLLVDGSDNFPTRFLTNDSAFFLRKAVVYGAIHRFEGQTGVFAPHLGGPCYRCLIDQLPAPGTVPSCQEAGVLGALPGIIGSIQAMEALKLLLGIGTVPLGRLTVYDALGSGFRSIQLNRDAQCRLCGDHPGIRGVANAETTAPVPCDFSPHPMQSITTTELRTLLAGDFHGLLIDVREPAEHAIARIEGARLIPLQTLPEVLGSLPKDREIYVHCKAGMRSAKAARLLLERGFTRVTNVAGGLDAWLKDLER